MAGPLSDFQRRENPQDFTRSESLLSEELPAEFFSSESEEERTSDVLQAIGPNPFEQAGSNRNLSSAEAIVIDRSRMTWLSLLNHFSATSTQYNSLTYDCWRMKKLAREFHCHFMNELWKKYPLLSQIPNLPSLIKCKNRMMQIADEVDFENRDIAELAHLCSALYRQLHALCFPRVDMPLQSELQIIDTDEIAESLRNNLRFLDEGIARNKARITACTDCKNRMMTYLD